MIDVTLNPALADLVSHPDWFADPQRQVEPGSAPIVLIDDFYPDPSSIRSLALSKTFVSYVPPDPAVVGEAIGARNAGRTGKWMSTALLAYHGNRAANPFHGFRYNPPELLERLKSVVGEEIDQATWSEGGDGWNGAFHLMEESYSAAEGMIHHHYKLGDVEGRGWSGVVYLSPDPPPASGTSIWRHRRTGRCVATFGEVYRSDEAEFELAFVAENRFNRLVLFRENVWHRAEGGFGSGAEARLTQTVFFQVRT